MELDPLIHHHLSSQPYPLLFVTVSGAHLYGFASADSDYDLRGCHIVPAREVLGLATPRETIEVMDKSGPIEVDLVTHDAKKFFQLLLKNNGYVLEQIFSPLVMHAAPEFEELKSIAAKCITKHHRHHFFNFAKGQWEIVNKSKPPTAKALLYTYRVLLAGIHLMRTAKVESNLRTLNADFRLPYIDDLIAMKLAGAEKGEVKGLDFAMHAEEFNRLCGLLDKARDESPLPEEAGGRAELSELLVRLRLGKLKP